MSRSSFLAMMNSFLDIRVHPELVKHPQAGDLHASPDGRIFVFYEGEWRLVEKELEIKR